MTKIDTVPARLSPSTLTQLDERVVQPGYEPSRHDVGIVHLGVGAFHRSHQAVYTDSVLALHGGDWRIVGVSLRSPTVAEQLNPQGGLYTVASKGEDSCEYRVIAAIERVIAAAADPHEAIEQMAALETKIVSLTITEKGYYRDASTGALATEHPDIVADLSDPRSPGTAVGCIVEALRRRRQRGLTGFTVLSCDNLSNNGAAARQVVVEYSELLDADLTRWIERNVTFPSSMVDRICPATTDVVDAALCLADIFESRAASSSVFRNSLVASLESIVRYGVLGAIGNYELRVERPRSEDVEPT